MLLTGSEGTTVENLLKTLPKVAVLVQGNWIVKSDIIYPQGTLSSTSGVPADVMCRARDYAVSKRSYSSKILGCCGHKQIAVVTICVFYKNKGMSQHLQKYSLGSKKS